MSVHPLRHSNALLIAWRLAELEAVHLHCNELDPVHFFLGLLKLAELDIGSILTENTALGNVQIQSEVAAVGQLTASFAQVGLETTQTRRRLRRSLPSGAGSARMGKHIRRSERARVILPKRKSWRRSRED